MWSYNNISPARGFSTPPPTCKSNAPSPLKAPASEKQQRMGNKNDLFHVIHKVPAGDSPYVRAKQVQLIEKDTNKAISLFWAAINSGDRVDSALKDMAVSMKQLNRSDEAIEAIKSFRHLCHNEAQESLDNVLVELYKRTGRLDDQIEMLQYKLKSINDGFAFGGKRTKIARSQGRKIQVTIEQEKSRLLGNLAWAYMQQGNYETAGELYKQALAVEHDKNKECNLAVCLMHMNKLNEAKAIIHAVRVSSQNRSIDDSYARSFERACQMLSGLEANTVIVPKEKKGHDEMKKQLRYPTSRISADSCINEGNDCVFDLVAARKQAGRKKVDKPNRGSYFQVQLGSKDNLSQPDDENPKLTCLGLSSAQSPQILCDDKWKRGAQLEIPSTRFDSSTRRNGDWVSTTEKVGFAQQANSPVPVRGNSKFPTIEQRGVSCLLSKANQRETSADFPSRKPSFKDPIAKEAQPEAPRNIDGALEASSRGKLKIALQTSDNNLLSHGGSWGDVGQVQSGGEMEPIPDRALNGTWNPWGISEYSQFKSDAIIESRSQAAANGNMEKNNWGNVEQQKFQMKGCNLSPSMLKNGPIMELRSQPVADGEKQSNYWDNLERKKFLMKEGNLSPSMQLKSPASVTRAVAPVSFNNGQAIANRDSKSYCWENGERNKFMIAGSNSSPIMQLRSPTPLDVAISPATFTDGECWEQSSDIQAMRDIRLAYNVDNKCMNSRNNKKSWADMVEEEEQGRPNFLGSKSDYSYQKSTFSLQTPEKWCNSWSHEEDFNDENLNSNIFHQTPPSLQEIDASYKLEALELKDHCSAPGSDVSSRKHLTARRSLCFGQHQEPDPAEHCCSSLLPNKASNFRGHIFVPENQHLSAFGRHH